MNRIFNRKIILITIYYFFTIYADFEADNNIDKSNIGNKRTNLYQQNPVLNGYKLVSELDDILQRNYY